jgi:hypothetical protein
LFITRAKQTGISLIYAGFATLPPLQGLTFRRALFPVCHVPTQINDCLWCIVSHSTMLGGFASRSCRVVSQTCGPWMWWDDLQELPTWPVIWYSVVRRCRPRPSDQSLFQASHGLLAACASNLWDFPGRDADSLIGIRLLPTPGAVMADGQVVMPPWPQSNPTWSHIFPLFWPRTCIAATNRVDHEAPRKTFPSCSVLYGKILQLMWLSLLAPI